MVCAMKKNYIILALLIMLLMGCPTVDVQKVIVPKKNIRECGAYIFEFEHVPIKSTSCIFPITSWKDAAKESDLVIEFAIDGKSDIPNMDISSVFITVGEDSKKIFPYKFKKDKYKASMYTDGLYYAYKKIHYGENVKYYSYFFKIERTNIKKFLLQIPELKDFCSTPKIYFKRKNRIKFRVWAGH